MQEAWKEAFEVGMRHVSDRRRRVASDRGDWSKNVLGDFGKRIKEIKKLSLCLRAELSLIRCNKNMCCAINRIDWRSKRRCTGNKDIILIGCVR